MKIVGKAENMRGSGGGFTIAVFKATDVPVNTDLYIQGAKSSSLNENQINDLTWKIIGVGGLIRTANTPFGNYILKNQGTKWDLFCPGDLPHDQGRSFNTPEDGENAANMENKKRVQLMITTL